MHTIKPLMEWEVSEHRVHQRSKRWYIIASLVGIALFTSSIFSANYLFAIIILIVAVTMILQERNGAPNIQIVIHPGGVLVGKKDYDYSLFKNFWLYYEPEESKMLFLEFKNSARPRLAIPLENKNPLRIRTLLLQFLAEDIEREHEPLSEQLSRLLKI